MIEIDELQYVMSPFGISDLRLVVIAIEIETIKAQLAQAQDPDMRKVLLYEMREHLDQADAILREYVQQLLN